METKFKLPVKTRCFLYTLLAVVILQSCKSRTNIPVSETNYILTEMGGRVNVVIIDSCEYLFYEDGYRMVLTHKGNCKFCAKRNNR